MKEKIYFFSQSTPTYKYNDYFCSPMRIYSSHIPYRKATGLVRRCF